MATMGSYCKAYPAERFAEFQGWRERHDGPQEPPAESGDQADSPDDRYLFLQENFVVTEDVFIDERVVFDDVTDEWKDFCRTALQFDVPPMDAEMRPFDAVTE